MKAKITKDGLCIDLSELLNSIAPEDKSELFKHIACDSQVIKDVTDQILDGWTEDGWHGTKVYGASAEPREWEAIDRAQREVAKRSGEVAKREIERLEKALIESENSCRKLEEEKRNAWARRESIL